jgi:ligand-binding sensor domain-containing protein/signal transduction histidine kinase
VISPERTHWRAVPKRTLKTAVGVLLLVGWFQATLALNSPLTKSPSEQPAVPQAIVSPVVQRYTTVEAGLLRFTRLSAADGLSHTRVAHIVQDPQGYMWLGTQYGLDRYDGYEFKHFVHDPRRVGSLAGTFVTALFIDREGTIWVACSQILDRFDARTQTFTHYQIDSRDAQTGDGTVVGISQDHAGFLWLSTGRGLHRMDPTTGTLTHFQHDGANPYSLSTNDIKWTGEDRSGLFWVGTADGLDRFDRASGRVLLHIPIPDGVGISVFEDSHGLFWITHASGNGLALFDHNSNTVQPVSFYAQDPPANALTGVMGILEDQDGNLWFGSPGGGVLKFDRENHRFLRYRFRGGTARTPVGAEDQVIALALDREGEIWAGLHSLGLNHFSRRLSPFRVYRHEVEDPNSLDIDFVNAIYEDRSGQLWIGNDLGLNRIDERSGRRELLTFGLGAKPMVISVLGDAKGEIWFGTFSNGLGRYDPATGAVRFYKHDPHDPTSLSNDEVHKMLVDRSGTLWVATDDGLDRFDPNTGRFTTYKVDRQGRRSQSYLALAEDSVGALWLGTHYSGLHRLDVGSGRITVFHPVPGDLSSLRDDSVPSVLTDDSGVIWVGTLGGLNRLDPKSGTFHAYDVTNGLAGNFVSCILNDAAGFLWMSTNRGISKFDPVNRTFVNYSIADGLPGNDLTGWGSCFRSTNGQLFFAGYSGAVAFSPQLLGEDHSLPKVVLTDFQLFGQPVSIGTHSPLDNAIDYTQHITLSHEQNVFSLGFSALSYRSPETNRYRYRLEGLNSQWTEVGSNRRSAVYTTLPAGHYVFRVQGASLRGPWTTPGTSLDIDILPPWWQTWWFRSTCFIVAFVVFGFLYQWKLRQIAARFALRMEERVAERTRIAQDLHDTVLQGLLSISLQLAITNGKLADSEPAKPHYVKILALLRQVVEESRNAVRGLRRLTADNNTLEQAISLIPQDLTGDTQTDLRLTVEGSTRSVRRLIREELYLMAREAFSNAWRHSGASQIEAVIQYAENVLRVGIRDDGMGIDPTIIDSGRSGHYGLSGMRERAERIGAELNVSSALNAGTEIEILVPGRTAYESASQRNSLGWLESFYARTRDGSGRGRPGEKRQ